MKKILFIICILCLFGLENAKAQQIHQSQHHNFKLVQIADGLDYPWAIALLPNGDILVTEKYNAKLKIIKNGTRNPKNITGLPNNIYPAGQGGLLDVEPHPNFKQNKYIYLSYAAREKNQAGTEVARAKLNGNKLENLKTIFKVQPKTNGRHHYGGTLKFAPDGTLFITVGDRYHRLNEAQNPENHLGTVIRINDDGSIPKNNPFAHQTKQKPEIYSYGHRNPQGLAVRPKDNTMWMHEHGPKGGDELNHLNKPGANYGWPKITYGIDYSGAIISDKTHAPNMEQPVIQWTPSIAPSGMTFYNADKFPKWKDNIFIGALAGQHIRRLELKENKIINQEIILKNFARIRDIITVPNGYLYFITDDDNGKIFRIEPDQ